MESNKTKVLIMGPRVIYGEVYRYARAFQNNGCEVETIDIREYYKTSFWNRALNWFLRQLIPIKKEWGTQRYYGVENFQI